MPAPPPESDPAMVSALGPRSSTRGKVVPPSRQQRPLVPRLVHGHDVRAGGDLADRGQGHAEAFAYQPGRVVDRLRRQRGQELVVLSSGERQPERVDVDHPGQLAKLGGHRHSGELDTRPHRALGAQARQVERQPVGQVHHRPATHLREGLTLPHPDPRPSPPLGRGAGPKGAPPAEPPSVPVTTKRWPGLAPARVTALPSAPSPTTATDTTTAGPRDRSPPTSDMAYSSHATSIPPNSSMTHGASTSDESARDTSAWRGLAPLAATSETLATKAFDPRSRADVSA